MGFGTLFIGYFLMLNITYYGFTDIIAALIMLLGLYKLSAVNKPFVLGTYCCIGFSVFALFELAVQLTLTFLPTLNLDTLLSCFDVIRCVVILAASLFMLMGMRDVAREVRLGSLSKKCARLIPATATIYTVWMLLEIPPLINLFPAEVISVIALFAILTMLAVICINLTAIYSCYMKICMPDEVNAPVKDSRFAFVNEYRKRQTERQIEYAKQRLEKQSQKRNNKK